VESLVRAKEGWLQDRIELFERYCVPSVRAQTTQDFDWIVYLDPESPSWLRDRIAPLARDGILMPVFRESVTTSELVSDIRGVVTEQREVLLTTNLDNDDGLSADFVARLQAVTTTEPRVAIYVTNGLVRSPQGLFLYRYPRNAFTSVRETWDTPVTSWSEWHTMLGEQMPVVELGGEPGWLQVIHGTNVSNRVRGRLVSPAPYRRAFGARLDGVPVPTAADRARDLLVGRPGRLARESSRAAAKGLIMRFLGRDGLDRVKVAWASRRRRALRTSG
jgi:hypothetical protein